MSYLFQICYVDFLKLVKFYGVSNVNIPKEMEDEDEDEEETVSQPVTSKPDMKTMEASRQLKMERFRKQKETNSKLTELWPHIEAGKADEETEVE